MSLLLLLLPLSTHLRALAHPHHPTSSRSYPLPARTNPATRRREWQSARTLSHPRSLLENPAGTTSASRLHRLSSPQVMGAPPQSPHK
ncbi:hypothetical protein C8Q73DRAFT_134843 [Cubamyces lactineus]|nr:hypothetical protein C8Q73DRAFT_134843 [Cubamyces lactineus]